MNKIHLLPSNDDPDNPVPSFAEEIMVIRIVRKFKLTTNKFYNDTSDLVRKSCFDIYECIVAATSHGGH